MELGEPLRNAQIELVNEAVGIVAWKVERAKRRAEELKAEFPVHTPDFKALTHKTAHLPPDHYYNTTLTAGDATKLYLSRQAGKRWVRQYHPWAERFKQTTA